MSLYQPYPEQLECTPETWWGAFYYSCIERQAEGKTYYTFLGWNAGQPLYQQSVIEAMYIGELILLDGKLYRFGEGFFFSPMGSFPFAPVDLAVILLSGLLTLAAVAGLTRKEEPASADFESVKP